MARVFNFSAGPAALPETVLKQAQAELLDFHGSGMSILEMSHRSVTYQRVIDHAEESLRSLMDISDEYAVLFFQGGATLQFAGVPMNLMYSGRAGYYISGHFAQAAWREASKYGEAVVLGSSEKSSFDHIPALGEGLDPVFSPVTWCAPDIDQSLDYAYICENNTIFGTEWHELPNTGAVPLVSDVSSCFLAKPVQMERYGLLYAGAQKNAGPAGVTMVIVRRDLISDGPALDYCPSYLDYGTQDAKGSMLNTPNTFGIYLCGLVFDWIAEQGGLAAMEKRNRSKASLIYGALDDSSLFRGTARPDSRSMMNATFTTGDAALDAEFVVEAEKHGLVGLKGHRLVGGMRASLYNAVPYEAVEELASFMQSFEADHSSACCSDRRSL